MKTLTLIQNELKVPKGNYNSFAKFRYRSTEDILEAVKPILAKHEAVLTISDDVVLIGERIFIKATATLSIGEEKISVNGFAETGEHKGMSSEQQTGCASSYSRKYALNGLFLIDETEADADSQPKEKPQSNVVSKPIPEPQPELSTIEKIRKTERAIRDLGGQVESFNPTGKNAQDQQQELESLVDQWKRLKASKGETK